MIVNLFFVRYCQGCRDLRKGNLKCRPSPRTNPWGARGRDSLPPSPREWRRLAFQTILRFISLHQFWIVATLVNGAIVSNIYSFSLNQLASGDELPQRAMYLTSSLEYCMQKTLKKSPARASRSRTFWARLAGKSKSHAMYAVSSITIANFRFFLQECFHTRSQRLCKFIGTKGSVCIRKDFNCHTGSEHPHGRRDVMWKRSIRCHSRLLFGTRMVHWLPHQASGS